MEEKKIEEIFKFKKLAKLRKTMIIMLIIPIIIGIYLYCNGLKYKEKPEAVNYIDLIEHHTDKQHDYVKVKINSVPICFSSESMEFYYIQDAEGNIFIASLDEETINKITEKYNNEKEEFFYDLEGYIFEIPIYIKELAMLQWEDTFQDAPSITEENYKYHLGSTYLSEKATPDTEFNSKLILLGTALSGIAIYLLVFYLTELMYLKLLLKEFNINEIKLELQKDSTKAFKREEIYLTDNYIVSLLALSPSIIRYNDLLLIYQQTTKYETELIGWTSNGDKFCLAIFKEKDKAEDVINLIKERKSQLLIGCSKENKKEYKNIIKNKKNNKK